MKGVRNAEIAEPGRFLLARGELPVRVTWPGARRNDGGRKCPIVPTLPWSGCRFEILSNDAGVTGGDSKEREGGSLGMPASLLPVSQSMDADAHGTCELYLCQPHEPPERGDIVA
jgi:hypothetical protein